MPSLSEEAKQLIKDSIDVESLLRTLGFKISRTTSSEVRAPCIIHGGDNPTAFSIRLDTKKWRCFTKRCEEDGTGRADNDLIALVRKITGRNFMDALQFLSDFSGLRFDRDSLFVADTEEQRRQRNIKKYINAVSRLSKDRTLPEITEEQVINFTFFRDDYFIERGFSHDTLDYFEVGSMTDRHGVPRATVPIRDAQGNLVGMSARRTDSDEEPRYLVEYEFQKGTVLYNMHRAIVADPKTVILVEGFKALWAMWEAGFHNVVAAMGANLSYDQVLELVKAGFTDCLIAFDGDKAGITGARLVRKKLKGSFNTSIITFPNGFSPDDFSREELKEIVNIYLYTL